MKMMAAVLNIIPQFISPGKTVAGRLTILGVMTLGLSGCYETFGDDYYGDSHAVYGGSLSYGCDPYAPYDSYYACDYGRGFHNVGYGGGWWNDFYYPGHGLFIFDRGGKRYRMHDQYRRYWGQRRHAWLRGRGKGYRNGSRRAKGQPGSDDIATRRNAHTVERRQRRAERRQRRTERASSDAERNQQPRRVIRPGEAGAGRLRRAARVREGNESGRPNRQSRRSRRAENRQNRQSPSANLHHDNNRSTTAPVTRDAVAARRAKVMEARTYGNVHRSDNRRRARSPAPRHSEQTRSANRTSTAQPGQRQRARQNPDGRWAENARRHARQARQARQNNANRPARRQNIARPAPARRMARPARQTARSSPPRRRGNNRRSNRQ